MINIWSRRPSAESFNLVEIVIGWGRKGGKNLTQERAVQPILSCNFQHYLVQGRARVFMTTRFLKKTFQSIYKALWWLCTQPLAINHINVVPNLIDLHLIDNILIAFFCPALYSEILSVFLQETGMEKSEHFASVTGIGLVQSPVSHLALCLPDFLLDSLHAVADKFELLI